MHIGHLLFSFHGRISRKMWWWTQIALWVFGVITIQLYQRLGFHDAVFGGVITLAFIVIRLMANVKRVHDRGKSGWWLLVYEIPVIGWIWGFIELGFLKGTEGENEHGETPLS